MKSFKIFEIEKKSRKGLLAIEWIILGYLVLTLLLALFMTTKIHDIGPLIWERFRFVMMMFQLVVITGLFAAMVRIASYYLEKNDNEMLKLASSSLSDACSILISPVNVLPVLFCICGFAHLVYSLMKGREDTGLILLIMFMIMLIVGGCIVPSVFLPEKAVAVGEHLPAYIWREDMFSGGMLRELVMGTLFFAGGEVLSWVHT